MMRLHRLVLSPLLALCLGVAAQPAPEPAEAVEPPASAMDDALLYQLLMGELNLNQGEPGAAYSLYLDAARKTDDAALYHRAVDIALQSRAGDAALQAAIAWKEAQPRSQEANRYLLQILIGLNRVRETMEPLRNALSALPPEQRLQSLASIPRNYLRATDHKLAATVVEQALQAELADPAMAGAAWAVLGRMRLNAGDNAGADEAARKLLQLDRPAEGMALLALELMEQKGPMGEALLQKHLQARPDPDMQLAYARLLMQGQRYAEAATQVQAVIAQKPEGTAAWLIQGSLQMQSQQFAAAQKSLQQYLDLVQAKSAAAPAEEPSRGNAQAYLYLTDIAIRNKDFVAANNWLDRIANNPDMVGVQTRRASILARQGNLDAARKLIQGLPGRDPDELRARVLSEAQLLRDAKQYRLAYDLLRQASTGEATDTDVMYEQAMLAEKLGDLPEMERLLRAVIAAKPDYQHAYNALGYSFAERRLRLPEAKQLIQKALEYAPGDPFISDSLGWVEFRLGNKLEAARILETAYKAHPDAEIAAHLGEVLWSLGEKARAIEFWKEGVKLNPESETLDETLKRLHVQW
jgi:tetratricopeptide (TPR) repeat protein